MNPTLIARRKEEHVVIVVLCATSLVSLVDRLVSRPQDFTEAPGFFVFKLLFALLLVVFIGNAIRQLMRKGPALVLDDAGLQDLVTPVRGGLIPWTAMSGARAIGRKGSVIVIDLHDPAAFIAERLGFKQRMARAFHRSHGSPVVIQTRFVKADANDLLRMIQERIPASSNTP
jgi:hypothetical protein